MEWIKCSDRLPEKDQWVLCFLDNNRFTNNILTLKFNFEEYINNGVVKKFPIFSSIDRAWPSDQITHWMPLPEAPKDEE